MSNSNKTDVDLKQTRDMVQSVYIAIVLAFILRAFLIEAFVIPTGSMANALCGVHVHVNCPRCQYHYSHGLDEGYDQSLARKTGLTSINATCPNCGLNYYDFSESDTGLKPKMFLRSGDRVLVMKYLYNFRPPQPWDVIVFKDPQKNRQNYIKRLIGLPGETIQIVNGNIYFKNSPDSEYKIRRKPWAAQNEMWNVIYDNDYPVKVGFDKVGNDTDGYDTEDTDIYRFRDPRWVIPAKVVRSQTPDKFGWDLGYDPSDAENPKKVTNMRVLKFTGSDTPKRIEFRPGKKMFYLYNGYNDSTKREHMTTEWKLSTVINPRKSTKGDYKIDLGFDCLDDEIVLRVEMNGALTLMHKPRGSKNDYTIWGKAHIGRMQGYQGRKIELVNVDYRVSVFVDDKLVIQTTDKQYNADITKQTEYAGLGGSVDEAREYLDKLQKKLDGLREDLSDLSIGEEDYEMTQTRIETAEKEHEKARKRVEKLTRLEELGLKPGIWISAVGDPANLSHVKIYRDVYYTNQGLALPSASHRENADYDYYRSMRVAFENGKKTPNSFDEDNKGWGTMGNPISLTKHADDPELDEFFCLGDNSSRSLDGRCWTAAAPSMRLYDKNGKMIYKLGTVPRYNIIGRAFMVYWPSGYRLFGWNIIPNFGKIRLIK